MAVPCSIVWATIVLRTLYCSNRTIITATMIVWMANARMNLERRPKAVSGVERFGDSIRTAQSVSGGMPRYHRRHAADPMPEMRAGLRCAGCDRGAAAELDRHLPLRRVAF